jgi:hypothetical protein
MEAMLNLLKARWKVITDRIAASPSMSYLSDCGKTTHESVVEASLDPTLDDHLRDAWISAWPRQEGMWLSNQNREYPVHDALASGNQVQLSRPWKSCHAAV